MPAMNHTPRITLAAASLAALAVPIGIAAAAQDEAPAPLTCGTELFGDQFVRTELFFGMSRPGGRITERQFADFVDDAVTPRFPEGLTLHSALGQFQLENGEIIEEKSKVLVLLHDGSDVVEKEIEQIRGDYVGAFDQQSVLRTDEPSCVSF